MLKRLRSLGPGLLVAAAFIGPGTVTTASTAGASFGYALLWALVFSIIATIVLQEMSARLGLVSREGLGEALRTTFDNRVIQILAIILVISAIAIGSAAFQVGNITGAALGLEALTGVAPPIWAIIIGIIAFALLASGIYKVIEKVLVGLVIVMSIVFIITAIIVQPDLGALFVGFVPGIPAGSLITVIALVGTTVVPYNFFLHASSVQEKWPEDVPTDQAVSEARFDTSFSVILGGIITLAILTTSAAAFFGTNTEISNAAQMAEQLEPLLGAAAKNFFAIGLLAAGLTSSVTAPLAGAFAAAGALGWSRDLKDRRFQAIWAVIIIFGTVFAALGTDPVTAIVFAQAANGAMLPVVAFFLLFIMNRSDLLGRFKNGTLANVIGGLVVLITAGLGVWSLLNVFGVVGG
jgi:manganese transport protein